MTKEELLIPFYKKWEGGYVNNPADKGGETNRGVTLATWISAGHDVAKKLPTVTVGRHVYENVTKSLYEMTDEQWLDIFTRLYFSKWKAEQIQSFPVAHMLVDWFYNSGRWGITIPQRLLEVEQDGKVGTKTIQAVNDRDGDVFFKELKEARIQFVTDIAKNHPSQKTFLGEERVMGWKNRIVAIEELYYK
ncbi:hypothetical protein Barb4_01163 [Bacteroidales bacterium Barb4]|nr:hypothetical protein Barb4_01163 [Bacteroidales bacterium Barb4]